MSKRLRVGSPVRVVAGHYVYLRGSIVAIHDQSVRDRRFDVRLEDRRDLLCFRREELETRPGDTI